jgi:hypothetical protein
MPEMEHFCTLKKINIIPRRQAVNGALKIIGVSRLLLTLCKNTSLEWNEGERK